MHLLFKIFINIFIIKHKPSYGLITSILASRNVPTISRACIMKLCILILFRMVFFDSGKFLECIFDKRLIFHSIMPRSNLDHLHSVLNLHCCRKNMVLIPIPCQGLYNIQQTIIRNNND